MSFVYGGRRLSGSCHYIHIVTHAPISDGRAGGGACVVPYYFRSVTSADRDVISGACSCCISGSSRHFRSRVKSAAACQPQQPTPKYRLLPLLLLLLLFAAYVFRVQIIN